MRLGRLYLPIRIWLFGVYSSMRQKYDGNSLAYLQNLTNLVKSLDGLGSDPFVSCGFAFLRLPPLHSNPALLLDCHGFCTDHMHCYDFL